MRSSLNAGHMVRSQGRKSTLKPSVLSLMPGSGLPGVPIPQTPLVETAGKAWAIHHLPPGASQGRAQQQRQGNSAELPKKLHHKTLFSSSHQEMEIRLAKQPASTHQASPYRSNGRHGAPSRGTQKNLPEEELSFVLHSPEQ